MFQRRNNDEVRVTSFIRILVSKAAVRLRFGFVSFVTFSFRVLLTDAQSLLDGYDLSFLIA
jgi:hypothetical protein